jgi:Protein of unknown function (DUF3300)
MTSKCFFVFLAAFCAGSIFAQQPAAPPPPVGGPAAAQPAGPPMPTDANASQFSTEQLKALLAPYALYPDPLLALILPASAVPSDIVLASRYLQAKKDVSQIDAQPWDQSVKALAHYPDIIKQMDVNLTETIQLGEAFTYQQKDVANVVQMLRAQAQAKGNLKTTPEQQVLVQDNSIVIQPAEPDVIYVPLYDPNLIYSTADLATPLLTFGAGLAVGSWLSYGWNWNNGYVGYWPGYYRPGYGWRPPHYNPGRPIVPPPGYHPWRPNPSRPMPPRPGGGGGGWNRPPGQGGTGRPPGQGGGIRPPELGGSTRPVPGTLPSANRPGRGDAGRPAIAQTRPATMPAARPAMRPANIQTFNNTQAFNIDRRGPQINQFSQRGQASLSQVPRSAPAPQFSRPAGGMRAGGGGRR